MTDRQGLDRYTQQSTPWPALVRPAAQPPRAPDQPVPSDPVFGSRALFPHLEHRIYVNHASVGPLPTPAMDAMTNVMVQQATHGVSAMVEFHQDVGTTRTVAASLMGVPADNIAVMGSTSAAISAVAASIPWKPGDRIVLFRGEFPANTTPWQQAAARYGLELAWLDADAFRTDQGLAELETVLQAGRVRMVAVSAVQFNTGLRMPVEAMGERAHAHGAAIFVDAIQAVGSTPIDATHLDYVATGGQKWLMGPPGTGLLYASDWSSLEATLAGWLSHEDALAFLWGDAEQLRYDRPIQVGPAALEGGTLNFAGLAGLTAAMRIINAHGVDAIHAHANRWNDLLEPHLLERGFTSVRSAVPEQRSAMLCVRPPKGMHAGAINETLQAAGVCASTPDAHIRFSPSWPNAFSEIDAVVAAISDAVDRLRP